MTSEMLERALEFLADKTSAIFEKGYGFEPDHCILGTRTAMLVLKELGIESKALVVQTVIKTRSYVELEEAGTLPDLTGMTDPDHPVWGPLNAAGTFAQVCGRGDPEDASPGMFNGHVVALVEDKYVLDTTLHQFNMGHAEGHVDLKPAWFPATWGFVHGDDAIGGDTLGGTRVIYKRTDAGRSFMVTSPDWRNTRRSSAHVKALLIVLRKELGI